MINFDFNYNLSHYEHSTVWWPEKYKIGCWTVLKAKKKSKNNKCVCVPGRLRCLNNKLRSVRRASLTPLLFRMQTAGNLFNPPQRPSTPSW